MSIVVSLSRLSLLSSVLQNSSTALTKTFVHCAVNEMHASAHIHIQVRQILTPKIQNRYSVANIHCVTLYSFNMVLPYQFSANCTLSHSTENYPTLHDLCSFVFPYLSFCDGC